MIEKVSVCISDFCGSVRISYGLWSKWFWCQGWRTVYWWLCICPYFRQSKIRWLFVWSWTWQTHSISESIDYVFNCIYLPWCSRVHRKLCCIPWECCSCAGIGAINIIESALVNWTIRWICCLEETSVAWSNSLFCRHRRIKCDSLITKYTIGGC